MGYAVPSGDIANDVRLKMADWCPFLIEFSNIFAHSSKTNRDSYFVLVANSGFRGKLNLVVILPMISDTKWSTGGHLVRLFQHFCS